MGRHNDSVFKHETVYIARHSSKWMAVMLMLMLRVLIQSPMVMIITLLFKWFLCIVFARVDLFGAILLIVCHISQTHSNPFLRRYYWFYSSFMYIIIVLYLHVCSLHSMFLTSPNTHTLSFETARTFLFEFKACQCHSISIQVTTSSYYNCNAKI